MGKKLWDGSNRLRKGYTGMHWDPTKEPQWALPAECQPTPVLLPRKLHGWRTPWAVQSMGRKESDTTEQLHFHPDCIVGYAEKTNRDLDCKDRPKPIRRNFKFTIKSYIPHVGGNEEPQSSFDPQKHNWKIDEAIPQDCGEVPGDWVEGWARKLCTDKGKR